MSTYLSFLPIPLLITSTVFGCQVLAKKNNEKNLENLRSENNEIENNIIEKEDKVADQITNILLNSKDAAEHQIVAGENNKVVKEDYNNISLIFVCFFFFLAQLVGYRLMSPQSKNPADDKNYNIILLITTVLTLFLSLLFQFYFLQTEDFFNYIIIIINFILICTQIMN